MLSASQLFFRSTLSKYLLFTMSDFLDQTVSLFISHSWDRSHDYRQVLSLLDDTRRPWRNLSIPKEEALVIAGGTEEAAAQRQALIEARLEEIKAQMQRIEGSLELLYAQRGAVQREKDELNRVKNLDTLYAEALRRISSPNYRAELDSLDELKRRYAAVDLPSRLAQAQQELQQVAAKIAALETDAHQLIVEQKRLLESLTSMKVDLGITGKQRDDAIRRYPNLAMAIRNQIARADAVIVIVYPHSAYREWQEFEYQEGFVLRKPLLGLVRDGRLESIPPDLRRFGLLPVIWSGDRIFDLVQESRQPREERYNLFE